MGEAHRVDGFVRHLEARIEAAIAGYDRIVLAYSGGLASTLVAMVARKRCDLQCYVAGVEGSPDVEAAKAAKDYLDYRMHLVPLETRIVRDIADRIAHECPRLTPVERRSLIPLHAVLGCAQPGRMIAGFGSPQVRPGVAAALRHLEVQNPLHGVVRGSLPRDLLREAALRLGLPVDWAKTAHRAPSAGAGIEDFLQRTAHARR